MSVEKIQQTLDLIDSKSLERPFLNESFSVSEDEIAETENRIGFLFSDSYREFLAKLGGGDFNGVEFYGLVSDKLDLEEIPNALWLTMNMRANEDLPNELFVIESLGDGTNACLLFSGGNHDECPVVLWDYGEVFNESKLQVLANSFGEYFYKRIVETIESN